MLNIKFALVLEGAFSVILKLQREGSFAGAHLVVALPLPLVLAVLLVLGGALGLGVGLVHGAGLVLTH